MKTINSYNGNLLIMDSGIKCPKDTTRPTSKASSGTFTGQLCIINLRSSAYFLRGLGFPLVVVTTSKFLSTVPLMLKINLYTSNGRNKKACTYLLFAIQSF